LAGCGESDLCEIGIDLIIDITASLVYLGLEPQEDDKESDQTTSTFDFVCGIS
jgi:hypothetical protein